MCCANAVLKAPRLLQLYMSVSCDNHMTSITIPLQFPCEHEELRRDLKQRNIEVSEEHEDSLHAGSKAIIGGPGAILVQLC